MTAKQHAAGRAGATALRFTAVLILAPAVPAIAGLPHSGGVLLLLGVIYLLLLARWPCAWLLVLPLVSVAVDLSSWTGRPLFNELDWTVLLTIGSGFLYARYELRAFALHWWCWPALLYLGLLVAGLGRWDVFLLPPATMFENPYYHVDYGYKLAKGALWGLPLAMLWLSELRRNRDRSVNFLVAGCVAAALALGLIILWERGTLAVLFAGKAWYHIANSLLDFGWSYRVTGLFSDMHTGGEVLDGMIVLLLPLTLYGVLHWKHPAARTVAALAVASLCYCTLVGFTRTTYAALAGGTGLYLGWEALLRRRALGLSARDFGLLLLALVSGGVAAASLYRAAGSYGLASFGALQCIAYAGWRLHAAGARGPAMVLLPVALATIGGGAWAHMTSRWVESSPMTAAVLVALMAASGLATLAAARSVHGWSESSRILGLGCLITGSAIVAIGVGGSQIENRMETLNRDMQTRLEHWHKVVASSGTGTAVRWFGNGVGTFPRNYVATYPETVRLIGSFSVAADNGGVLQLGPGHDLAFAQRVSVEPDRDYLIRLELRAAANARLDFYLCDRNVLFASNFARNCAQARIRVEDTGGEFVTRVVPVSSDRVGRGGWLRWPGIFYVKNERRGNPVELRSLELFGDGQTGLRNADFREGLDHWFFYCDFAHLPWHIKNTWLHFWYETGWLGLAAMLSALVLAVLRASRAAGSETALPSMASAVVTLGTLGLFGTPLDSPRVGWLFFFCLFTVLCFPARAPAASSS